MMLAAASISSAAPASAQGLFDFLFSKPRPRLPPPAFSYADPLDPQTGGGVERISPNIGGPQVAFCVRLCDGRYFPIQRNANATPAQICQAVCPASKTKIFSGSVIDHAVAPDGNRYADLNNAYVYRNQLIANCTCNGKDSFGLAPLDVNSDPTLRPGDMVATNDGVVAFRGRNSREAQFTPVDKSRMRKTAR
jgi:hypothetical protein